MKRIALILSIAIITIAISTALRTGNIQSQTRNVPPQYKLDPDIPIVDINSPAFRRGEDREIRKSRGEKYNTGHPLEDVFTRSKADLLELPLSHAPAKTAIPVSQSDAILIGTVINSQAFLSTDKSYVYSEFTVEVEEVLKNFSSAALAPNVTTTIERAGGIVRFASGKTLQLGNGGEGFPQRQKRYILFLKWSNSGKDFTTLTGYELNNGKVTPLDGTNDLSIYKNYRQYQNEDESKFLQIVKGFLDNPVEEVPNK